MRFSFNRKKGGVVERGLITVISATVSLATSDYLDDFGKKVNGLVNVIAISMLGGAIMLKRFSVAPEPVTVQESSEDEENLDAPVLSTTDLIEQKWSPRLKYLDYFKLPVIVFAASLDFLGEYEDPSALFDTTFAAFALIFAVEATYFLQTKNYLDMTLKLGLTGVSIGSVITTHNDTPEITSHLWKAGTACALFLTANQIRQVRKENNSFYTPALVDNSAFMKSDHQKLEEEASAANKKTLNG